MAIGRMYRRVMMMTSSTLIGVAAVISAFAYAVASASRLVRAVVPISKKTLSAFDLNHLVCRLNLQRLSPDS
jgi:hypothetical protein